MSEELREARGICAALMLGAVIWLAMEFVWWLI